MRLKKLSLVNWLDMKSSLYKMAAGLSLVTAVGCQTPSRPVQPDIRLVHFRESNEDLPEARDLIENTPSGRIIRARLDIRRKIIGLCIRRDFLRDALREHRTQLSAQEQLQFELELRALPAEIHRLIDQLRRRDAEDEV